MTRRLPCPSIAASGPIAYLFFSLAATKMPAYCGVVSPLVYVALSTLLESAIAAGSSLVPQRGQRTVAVVVLATLGWFDLGLRPGHDKQVPHAAGLPAGWQVHEAAFYRSLPAELPPGRFAIFNCRRSYQAAAMFYSGMPAYELLPDPAQVRAVRDKGYRVVVLDDGRLPAWLREDDAVVKIRPPP